MNTQIGEPHRKARPETPHLRLVISNAEPIAGTCRSPAAGTGRPEQREAST